MELTSRLRLLPHMTGHAGWEIGTVLGLFHVVILIPLAVGFVAAVLLLREIRAIADERGLAAEEIQEHHVGRDAMGNLIRNPAFIVPMYAFPLSLLGLWFGTAMTFEVLFTNYLTGGILGALAGLAAEA